MERLKNFAQSSRPVKEVSLYFDASFCLEDEEEMGEGNSPLRD